MDDLKLLEKTLQAGLDAAALVQKSVQTGQSSQQPQARHQPRDTVTVSSSPSCAIESV